MEGSVPCDTLASQQLRSNTESVTTPNIQTQYGSGDLSMNDLKTCLNEFVSVEDVGVWTKAKAGSNSKCDSKDSDESGDDLPESTSSAALSRLASAMKGSREKQGVPPKKLSVTWAPDVYDPIPTSVSHVPSSRNQYIRSYGRKYGKNKQKGGGKASRGGKGKDRDKKQARKNGGTATKVKSAAASFSEPEAGIAGFNVISADAFCGSSFLKESVQNMHFPVAEAMR